MLSDRRRSLSEDLLSCNYPVEMNLQDWTRHPRICDIVAAFLMRSTNGKVQFPINGSVSERDKAIAMVQRAIKEDPDFFPVLRVHQ